MAKDEAPAELPAGMVNIPIEKVVASLQRQMADLHQQLAIKDAALEMAQEELAVIKASMDQLAKARPAHNGRTTPARRRKT